MNYRLSILAEIVGGQLFGEDRFVDSVSTDSRNSLSGEGLLFVAIGGVNYDSHDFVDQMYQRGVRSFLVERGDVGIADDCSYIVVDSSIEALQRWAAHHRSEYKGCVVAITGSNGKTTIKEWFAQSIPGEVKLFRSPRSYNSQLGVALSLLMIEGDEDVVLIEAGISREGEMERLERMIKPDVVVISSIGEAHQEGFTSLDRKVEEKLILAKDAKKIIYHSDYESLRNALLYRSVETIDSRDFEAQESCNQAARSNSQVVAAMCHTLGYPAPNLSALGNIAMRLEVIEGVGDSVIINDSYNSDLNSLEIALDELMRLGVGRECVVILSDIVQSGVAVEELYGRVNELLKRSGVARLIGVGHEMLRVEAIFDTPTTIFASTEELIAKLTVDDYGGRAILLKGSRDSHFEDVAHALAKQSHTTVLEVDLEAMAHNYNYLRSFLSRECKVVAMVKARSYGASGGGVEIANALQQLGVDYLAVAFADEGTELRRGGSRLPIIVLNADDGSFSQMVDNRLEPEIYSLRSLREFAKVVSSRAERDYPIHIKLDTGMHRLGFMDGQIESLCRELKSYSGVVKVASIFSHLAMSDMGESGEATTRKQIDLFGRLSSEIESGIGYKTTRHLANSAAVEYYADSHFDMVRFGIGLYGFGGSSLMPISRLATKIVQIRELSRGEGVGYGQIWSAERDSRVATIPIGYADGLDRRLGGGEWSVLIAGRPAPIVGRVCMDSCMVDITELDQVKEGDEVVIFSSERDNRADNISTILGTIPYEVLTSISNRVKRIYIK